MVGGYEQQSDTVLPLLHYHYFYILISSVWGYMCMWGVSERVGNIWSVCVCVCMCGYETHIIGLSLIPTNPTPPPSIFFRFLSLLIRCVCAYVCVLGLAWSVCGLRMNLGVNQRPAPGEVLRRMQHQHDDDREQVLLVPPPTPPPSPPQGKNLPIII